MRQTLFYIPEQWFGWPLLGVGLLLAVWAVIAVAALAVQIRRGGLNADFWATLPVLLIVAAVIVWVLPSLAEPGHGLPVRGYGVMMLLGVVSGVGLTMFRARRVGLDPELIYSLAFWMCVAGIVGARVFYVIKEWDHYSSGDLITNLREMLNVAGGGLVVYGSVFGAGAAFLAFVRRYRLPPLKLADVIGPGLLVGLAFGRVGCFLNGCCFGGVCEPAPWAVRFPVGSPPHMQQLEDGALFSHGLKFSTDEAGRTIIQDVEPGSAAERAGLRAGQHVTRVNGVPVESKDEAIFRWLGGQGPGQQASIAVIEGVDAQWTLEAEERSLPVHPAQLYSAVNAALLCWLLLAIEPYLKREGELICLLFVLYGGVRFLEELIRTDEPAVFGTGMNAAQWISLAMIAAFGGLWRHVRRQGLPRAPFGDSPASNAAV